MTEETANNRALGLGLFIYSLLIFAITVHLTTHALGAAYLWLNVIPLIYILVSFSVVYGDKVHLKRAAAWIGSGMAYCALMLLYLLLALPWRVNWLMVQYLFNDSFLFYGLNLFVLGFFQWRFMGQLQITSFWRESPWRAGLIVFVLAWVFLLYALSLAWRTQPLTVTIPANNMVQYLQGEGVQFTPTSINYQKRGEQYWVEANGYAYTQRMIKPVKMLWTPISSDTASAIFRAANSGDADAQLSLGVAYLASMGAASDLNDAVKWFKQAAKQQNASAEEALAIAYLNGAGTEKNIQKAYDLLQKSAKGGNIEAKQLCAKITRSLSWEMKGEEG